MNPSALTILIVAHNEEREIAACLETCRFADEIVVVLDRCTDGTKDIALDYGAKLVEGSWANEGQRRMAGIAASSGPWILEIDADERVPPALAAEIRGVLANAAAGIFGIPFHNYVGKRLVRHGWGRITASARKAACSPRAARSGARIWCTPR